MSSTLWLHHKNDAHQHAPALSWWGRIIFCIVLLRRKGIPWRSVWLFLMNCQKLRCAKWRHSRPRHDFTKISQMLANALRHTYQHVHSTVWSSGISFCQQKEENPGAGQRGNAVTKPIRRANARRMPFPLITRKPDLCFSAQLALARILLNIAEKGNFLGKVASPYHGPIIPLGQLHRYRPVSDKL